MALIKCSECRKKISDKAAACPRCGAPVSAADNNISDSAKDGEQIGQINSVQKKSLLIKLFVVLDILALIIICIYLFAGDTLKNLTPHESDDENNIVDTTELVTERPLQAAIILPVTEATEELIADSDNYNKNDIISNTNEEELNAISDDETESLTEPTAAELAGEEPESTEPVTNLLILKEGDRNDDVKDLQVKLRDIGLYSENIDGSFGARTKTAVKELQEMYNLAPDGIVSSETWTALYNALWLIEIAGNETPKVQSHENDINNITEPNGEGILEENITESDINDNPEIIGLNGLEITFQFGEDIILEQIDDASSGNNGRDVFKLSVIVKNLKSEPDRLSRMNITQYGISGKLDDISDYFDDIQNTDIGGGESVSGYMYFLYEGNGDYSVEFEHNGKKHEVAFSISYDNRGKSSDYTLTLE